ncbi:hypothetical protein [Saccharopolyspora pogona]|uniref:hypothetical protein n=1 Tax=Saccharopolyspora pogona TaxID=333966 RepID=UPI00168313DB|nr:hypothetical protein [Saccharopolyspora pogona]
MQQIVGFCAPVQEALVAAGVPVGQRAGQVLAGLGILMPLRAVVIGTAARSSGCRAVVPFTPVTAVPGPDSL